MVHLYTTSQQNADNMTIQYGSVEKSDKRIVKATDFALDISGKVMDNKAYDGQGKTAEDIMQSAGLQDVALQQNYMTVMSNSMSDEDFSKLCEEGISPQDTDIETSVTVVDQIKARLAQSGVIISGYNDDLDIEKLKEITGSATAANAIEDAFRKADIPITKENAEAASKVMEQAKQIMEITDGMCDYLLRNGIEPTIDHLYRVRFSAAQVPSNGGGYYADDVNGYLTKQAEDFQWDAMNDRLSQTIENAGLPVNEETMQEAQWLIRSGILFNERNISTVHQLRQIQTPLDENQIAIGVAAAIADGKSAADAVLSNDGSKLTLAADAYKDVQNFTPQAVAKVIEDGKKLNIRELRSAAAALSKEGSAFVQDTLSENKSFVSARRALEETRLVMSIESNYRLLKQGISIDTTELSDLVEQLKKTEEQTNQILFGEENATDKAILYKETQSAVADLPKLPAAVVGETIKEDGTVTLSFVHHRGSILQSEYIAAGESYEALQTEVRTDLGDSIKKAFGNVDEILADLKLEPTEVNRRAIRILGYNRMELTNENVNLIKEADGQLQRLIHKMTPASCMKLIRENINPMNLTLSELEAKLDSMENTPVKKAEKYSEFLYNLDQKGEITQEERESYIGIYRLLHQIEKGDDASVGAIVNQGNELTFKNLLSAMRTGKSSGMDIKVDNSFGELVGEAGFEYSISEQILKAFESFVTSDEESAKQYRKEQMSQIQESLQNAGKEACEELLAYHQPITPDNIAAMNALLGQEGIVFQNLLQNKAAKSGGAGREGSKPTNEMNADGKVDTKSLVNAEDKVDTKPLVNAEDKVDTKPRISAEGAVRAEQNFLNAVNELQDAFIGKQEAADAYQNLVYQAGELLENAIGNSATDILDLKAMTSSFKQLSLAGQMVNEESYEVPVMMNGKVQSLRVKIVHGNKNDGNVIATTSTLKYGNLAAQFTLEGDTVHGYIAGDSKEGIDLLKKEGKFEQTLLEEGKTSGDIKYLYSEKLDLSFFYRRHNAKAVKDSANTKQLYETAKAFIRGIQDTEGVETHEN